MHILLPYKKIAHLHNIITKKYEVSLSVAKVKQTFKFLLTSTHILERNNVIWGGGH